MACQTERKATAEAVPLKRGKKAGVRDGRRRMQHWMVVNLCNQCSHLQLPRSCSSPGKQSAASEAKAVRVTPCKGGRVPIQARKEYAMETVEVWGRGEEVREEAKRGRRGQARRRYIETEGVGVRADGKC